MTSITCMVCGVEDLFTPGHITTKMLVMAINDKICCHCAAAFREWHKHCLPKREPWYLSLISSEWEQSVWVSFDEWLEQLAIAPAK